MGTGGTPAVVGKSAFLTPVNIIHQKFGDKACYKVEEVQECGQNGCPGLAIQQKGPCLFRCCLELPEFSVVSEPCKSKKDAKQSAAGKALEKLGIDSTENKILTVEEAWDEMVSRLLYLFSDEFLSTIHPLSGHFRSSLQRKGHFNGFIPVSVIAVYDTKLGNLCKHINPKIESNPVLVMPFITNAAARLRGTLFASEDQLSLRRQNPYSSEATQSLVDQQTGFPETILVKAIRIPQSVEKAVESLTLNVTSNGYYLDVIANELGVTDASKVMVSRTVGKSSSEMRVFFCVPKSYMLDPSSEPNAKEAVQFDESLNARASYISCQHIYGDAILASAGYKWKSNDFFKEDVSLRTYYRTIFSKIPAGIYKLSRDAMLAAEFPVALTTRNSWRGSFPKEILCMFCRQHRLSEPVFTMLTKALPPSPESPGSSKTLKVTESDKEEVNGVDLAAACHQEPVGSIGEFTCELKIFSKFQDLIIHCSPKECYKKQTDALQNAALKVLSWFDMYFKNLNMPVEKLVLHGNELDLHIYPPLFCKEFVMCSSVHTSWWSTGIEAHKPLPFSSMSQQDDKLKSTACSTKIEGPVVGVTPAVGSLVCITYSISLVTGVENVKDLLESGKSFEFEVGTGSVIPSLESVVTQMTEGQSAYFNTELPPEELILAATADPEKTLSLLSSRGCKLEYAITLLQVTEPSEERMEQALFSPPLSKQRVEYAVQHIKESCATTLVDFGCGSGSLLDSLLDYPTSLEIIIGVDISQKSLIRAAKTLHSKLNASSGTAVTNTAVNSVQLYEGSITNFDSRLYGFDIGTCLEVIEHMEEDQAYLFGDLVLSTFRPRILVVSTPNYEYNVILQKSSLHIQEDDGDEKNQSQSCKFRNHDHKFEWTREQFNCWASDLAMRHKYHVEFSGVGGAAGVEPGFASQIAVFRSRMNEFPTSTDSAHLYEVLWEWNRPTGQDQPTL